MQGRPCDRGDDAGCRGPDPSRRDGRTARVPGVVPQDADSAPRLLSRPPAERRGLLLLRGSIPRPEIQHGGGPDRSGSRHGAEREGDRLGVGRLPENRGADRSTRRRAHRRGPGRHGKAHTRVLRVGGRRGAGSPRMGERHLSARAIPGGHRLPRQGRGAGGSFVRRLSLRGRAHGGGDLVRETRRPPGGRGISRFAPRSIGGRFPCCACRCSRIRGTERRIRRASRAWVDRWPGTRCSPEFPRRR